MTANSTENSKRKLEVIKDTLASSFVKKIKTEVTGDFQTSSSKVVFSCGPCNKSFANNYLLGRHLLSYAHEMMNDDVIGYRCSVCNRIYKKFFIKDMYRHLRSKKHLENSRSNPSVKSKDAIIPIRKSDVLNSVSIPKTHVPSETSSSSDDEYKAEDQIIVNHLEPEGELISSYEEEYEVKPEAIKISQSASTPEQKTIEKQVLHVEMPMDIKFEEEEAEMTSMSTENSKRKLEELQDSYETSFVKEIKTEVREDFQENEIIAKPNATASSTDVFFCEPCNKHFSHEYFLDRHRSLSYSHNIVKQAVNRRKIWDSKVKSNVSTSKREDFPETELISKNSKAKTAGSSSSKNKFSCKRCDKHFTHKYLLNGHLLSYSHKVADVIGYRCCICNEKYSKTFITHELYRHLQNKTHLENARLNPFVKSEDAIIPIRREISKPKTLVPSETSSSRNDEDKDPIIVNHVKKSDFLEPEMVELTSSDDEEDKVKPETIEISQSTPKLKITQVKTKKNNLYCSACDKNFVTLRGINAHNLQFHHTYEKDSKTAEEENPTVFHVELPTVQINFKKEDEEMDIEEELNNYSEMPSKGINQVKSSSEIRNKLIKITTETVKEMQMNLKQEEEVIEIISSDEDEVKPETMEISQSELKAIEVKTEAIEEPEVVNSCHLASIDPEVIKVEEFQVTIKSEPEVETNAPVEFEVPRIVNSFALASSIDPEVEVKQETILEVELTSDVPKINETPNFPCTKCSKKFQQISELESHLAIHLRLERLENPNPTKSSDYFPYKVKSTATLNKTANSSTEGKEKKKRKSVRGIDFCPICMRTFSRKSLLNDHYARLHPDVPIPSKLPRPKKPKTKKVIENDETQITWKKMKRTNNKNTKDEFFCVPCATIFSSKGNLTRHNKDAHGGQTINKQVDEIISSVLDEPEPDVKVKTDVHKESLEFEDVEDLQCDSILGLEG